MSCLCGRKRLSQGLRSCGSCSLPVAHGQSPPLRCHLLNLAGPSHGSGLVPDPVPLAGWAKNHHHHLHPPAQGPHPTPPGTHRTARVSPPNHAGFPNPFPRVYADPRGTDETQWGDRLVSRSREGGEKGTIGLERRPCGDSPEPRALHLLRLPRLRRERREGHGARSRQCGRRRDTDPTAPLPGAEAASPPQGISARF